MARVTSWARGAWDVHVHAAPSLFPRWGDAWDLAAVCREAGMAGVVVKSHHGSTVELASLLDRQWEGLSVFGGVTLNRFVGGLNPYAVETAVALGGRFVWMPTLHSADHGEKCGCLGGFGFQTSAVKRVPREGLSVLQGQRLCSEAMEIMEVLDGTGVVLASGHLSAQEVEVLVKERDRAGFDIPILINHVLFHTPGLSTEQLRSLQGDAVWFELVQLCVSELVAASTVEHAASVVQALPGARWVLATDSGQVSNLPCPQALDSYASQLYQCGVSEERLHRMLKDEPRALLGEDRAAVLPKMSEDD